MVLHLSRVFLTRVKPDYHIRLIMDRMTDSGRLMTGFNAVWFTLHWHETFTCKTSWLLFSNCNEDLVVNRALSPFCRDVTRGLSWDQPHQMHPAQKSYQPNQQRYRPEYLPTRNPPAVRALLIKFQPPRFTFSPQFGILPTVSDSTHRSLWFATLFPSSPLLPPNVTGICTDFPFLQLLPRLCFVLLPC